VPEAWEIADGSTGYSTGNLYAMFGGKGVHSVKEKWDEDAMKQVVASRAAAVEFTGEQVKEFAIDCDFTRVSRCLFSNNQEQESYVQKEQEAATTAGLKKQLQKNWHFTGSFALSHHKVNQSDISWQRPSL
jgi:hypothetical protein